MQFIVIFVSFLTVIVKFFCYFVIIFQKSAFYTVVFFQRSSGCKNEGKKIFLNYEITPGMTFSIKGAKSKNKITDNQEHTTFR